MKNEDFAKKLNDIIYKECRNRKHQLIDALATRKDVCSQCLNIEEVFHFYRTTELSKDVSTHLKFTNIVKIYIANFELQKGEFPNYA